jgi:hypothetical protein
MFNFGFGKAGSPNLIDQSKDKPEDKQQAERGQEDQEKLGVESNASKLISMFPNSQNQGTGLFGAKDSQESKPGGFLFGGGSSMGSGLFGASQGSSIFGNVKAGGSQGAPLFNSFEGQSQQSAGFGASKTAFFGAQQDSKPVFTPNPSQDNNEHLVESVLLENTQNIKEPRLIASEISEPNPFGGALSKRDSDASAPPNNFSFMKPKGEAASNPFMAQAPSNPTNLANSAEPKIFGGSSMFDIKNDMFAKIKDSDESLDKPVLTESIYDAGKVTESGFFNSQVVEDSKPKSNLIESNKLQDSKNQGTFGNPSGIAPPTKRSASPMASLFGSAFPIQTDKKAEEKLKFTISENSNTMNQSLPDFQVSAIEKKQPNLEQTFGPDQLQSAFLSQIEGNGESQLKGNKIGFNDFMKVPEQASQEESSKNFPINVYQEESELLDQSKSVQTSQDIENQTLYLKKKEEIQSNEFILPLHFPQMLLFFRWNQVTERILDEHFEAPPEDLEQPPVKCISCLFDKSSELYHLDPLWTKPRFANFMRCLFESSVSLLINLYKPKMQPLILTTSIFDSVKPEDIPAMLFKVMIKWSNKVFLSDGPRLTLEDGRGLKQINGDRAKNVVGEEERSKEIYLQNEKLTDSQDILTNFYAEKLKVVSVDLVSIPAKSFSLSLKLGVHQLVVSLKIKTDRVTLREVDAGVLKKGASMVKMLEEYSRIVDYEVNVLKEFLNSNHKTNEATKFLNSSQATLLFDMNLASFDLCLFRDQTRIYSGGLEVLPEEQNLSELDFVKFSRLQASRKPADDRPFIVLTSRIEEEGECFPMYQNNIIVPVGVEGVGKELCFKDVIYYVLTECFCLSSSEHSFYNELLEKLPTLKIALNGRTVSSENFESLLDDVLPGGVRNRAIYFLDIKLSFQIPNKKVKPKERGIVLELLPSITEENLPASADDTTVLMNIKCSHSSQDLNPCTLPVKIGKFVRLSAFERLTSKVIARVRINEEWREIDYSSSGVRWLNDKEKFTDQNGFWVCALYQKEDSSNSPTSD